MASTYSSLYVHIIFATRGRAPMIADSWRQDLHSYIGGIIKGLDARPMIAGRVSDHVHILVSLKTSHSISDLVREIKKASSIWAKERFASFGWQEGYAVISISVSQVPAVTSYIARQEEHHRKVSSADELRAILEENGIEFDARFFE